MRKQFHPTRYASMNGYEPDWHRNNFRRRKPYNPYRWTPNYPIPRRMALLLSKL